jgi:hypothetical protein
MLGLWFGVQGSGFSVWGWFLSLGRESSTPSMTARSASTI